MSKKIKKLSFVTFLVFLLQYFNLMGGVFAEESTVNLDIIIPQISLTALSITEYSVELVWTSQII